MVRECTLYIHHVIANFRDFEDEIESSLFFFHVFSLDEPLVMYVIFLLNYSKRTQHFLLSSGFEGNRRTEGGKRYA